MYGHDIPTGLDSYMNTVTYPVEVPGYAVSKHPSLENGDLEPMFIFDKNTTVYSRATVAMMVDFCDRVIRFKIIDTNDILEIDQYLKRYMAILSQYPDVPTAAEYVLKARRFSDMLQRSIRIISRTNPAAAVVTKRAAAFDIFKQAAGV